MINWQWARYDELSNDELLEVFRARQSVFIIEQGNAYADIDELDKFSWHFMGWNAGMLGVDLAAYCRVTFPGCKFPEVALSHVMTSKHVRGTGVGRQLMEEVMRYIDREYPQNKVRLSAQQPMESFYKQFGFVTVSESYMEDGGPHVEMLRRHSPHKILSTATAGVAPIKKPA